MMYPSGLLRQPLRFTLRRAVVATSAWRPGQYIVLDTGGRRYRVAAAAGALLAGGPAQS